MKTKQSDDWCVAFVGQFIAPSALREINNAIRHKGVRFTEYDPGARSDTILVLHDIGTKVPKSKIDKHFGLA